MKQLKLLDGILLERYSIFQMVMCISLICISNQGELVRTYQRENMQQMTHVIFCKLLLRGFYFG